MQISPINSNYQNNNTNFKGIVDKSVVRYLKEFQTDAIKSKKIWNNLDKDALAQKLPKILNELKEFMAKLHSDTKLVVVTRDSHRDFKLVNSKLGSENLLRFKNMLNVFFAREDHNYGKRQWHDNEELNAIEEWSKIFQSQNPKDLDNQIFNKFLDNIAEDAKHAGFFTDIRVNRNVEKAFNLAHEFGVINVNTQKIVENMLDSGYKKIGISFKK